MCAENELNKLLITVSNRAKEMFSDRLNAVILYGSYARGDFDEESDVDILFLVDMTVKELAKFRGQIDELCGSLLFDYGVVVSITEKDVDTYNRYVDILPFYRNIKQEGLKIA